MVLVEAPPGLDIDRITRTAVRRGLPHEHVRRALELLREAGLVRRAGDAWRLEPDAAGVADSLQNGDWSTFAVRLLTIHSLRSQLAALIPHAYQGGDGTLRISRRRASATAPQASILLSWMGGGSGFDLQLPSVVVQLASLDEPTETIPGWVEERGRVGKRAESYSLLFERLRRPPNLIIHVAAERDDMGYDIEDRSGDPVRAIEVKGSRSPDVTFMLTKRELQEARVRGEAFELQFWGEIDLGAPIDREFSRLVDQGYPRRFPNLSQRLASGEFSLTPVQWEVRQATLRGRPPRRH